MPANVPSPRRKWPIAGNQQAIIRDIRRVYKNVFGGKGIMSNAHYNTHGTYGGIQASSRLGGCWATACDAAEIPCSDTVRKRFMTKTRRRRPTRHPPHEHDRNHGVVLETNPGWVNCLGWCDRVFLSSDKVNRRKCDACRGKKPGGL